MPKVPKVTSLQVCNTYLKEEMKDGFDFFNEDKHQRFVQVDTIVFGGYS